jgi:thioredoxin-like negative regulator of GroEL
MPDLHVISLCAAWCGTCRDFQQPFEQLRERLPDARFEWIDIEDEADRVGDIDIDDFPVVVIAREGRPVFFGTMRPTLGVLERAVAQADDPRRDAPIDPAQRELIERLLKPTTPEDR